PRAPPGFPFPWRTALAELLCAAPEGAAPHAALAWLTEPHGPPPAAAARRLAAVHLIDPGGSTLLAVHAPWDAAVRTHAERGLRAAAAYRARGGTTTGTVDRAVAQAAALWEQALFFEGHEVLEVVAQREGGPPPQALHGLL